MELEGVLPGVEYSCEILASVRTGKVQEEIWFMNIFFPVYKFVFIQEDMFKASVV